MPLDQAHSSDDGHDHSQDGRAHGQSPSKLRYAAPATWVPVANASDFLLAAFDVQTQHGRARVTVSALAGMAGGILPNINRWRGQVGLPPVATLEQQPITTPTIAGQESLQVDLVGPAGLDGDGRRQITAMFAFEGQMWFFKIDGDAAAVADQREAFDAFLKSATFVTDAPGEAVKAPSQPGADHE